MFNFSIIIPIFNEDKNIDILINEILTNLKSYKSYEIIIVDDCSTDLSREVLEKYNQNPKFKLLYNKINRGQSFSIKSGISKAAYNSIITIDGDGQNDPSDIKKLVNLYFSENHIKMVAGIRKKRKDKIIKIISSKLANYIRDLVLKDGCKDTGCSLKIFDKEIFDKLPFFDGMHRFLPALFLGKNQKVIYTDVNHRTRKFGISKYGTFGRMVNGIRDIIKVKKIISRF